MKKNQVVLETYKNFCNAEGNQHIASEYAILKLQELIDHFKPKNVLEVGLGIGAIAGSLLVINENLEYAGTEDNEFCLGALKTNLDENFRKLKVFSKLSEVPDQKFDLIIIDGKDPDLEHIRQLVAHRGIIAIEGDRKSQLQFLEIVFPKNRLVHSISIRKNKIYSPYSVQEWQGGLKVMFTDPNQRQFLWWWKEKIKTKLKYQLPGRFLGE